MFSTTEIESFLAKKTTLSSFWNTKLDLGIITLSSRKTAYTILNGEYEVIEAEIIETSELINKELKNSNLPDEIRIGAVLREDKVIIPRSSFVFQKDDRVFFG